MKSCQACQGDYSLYHCSTFKGLTTQEKWNVVKQAKLCFNCLRPDHSGEKCKSSSCKQCNKRHNSLLHIDEFYPRANASTSEQSNTENGRAPRYVDSQPTLFANTQRNTAHAMLSTALVKIYDKFGKAHTCRAVLDCGSQSNLLTSELCQRLQLVQYDQTTSITGINMSQSTISAAVNTTIKSLTSEFKVKLSFLVLDQITQCLPAAEVDMQRFLIPDSIALADPSFNVPGKVDILLGAGIFWGLLCVGQHVVSRNLPSLHNTKLGWVVGGNVVAPESPQGNRQTSMCCFTTEANLLDQVERFWKIEEYAPSRKFSKEEKLCEEEFKTSYERDAEGRFTVALSFRVGSDQLGESRDIAVRRLRAINRKLDRQPELKAQYEELMNEYITLGHMSEINNQEKEQDVPHYYIPHHAVLKETSISTKLRVVFDASCKTSSGKFLNDILRVGPTIQQDLFSIVLHFRQHQHVITADITKMYRQVHMREDHRDLQRILWRANVEQPIKEYRVNTVTYGIATAPFLAIRSLQQLAIDNRERDPEISEIILRDFYVDDLLTGCVSIDEVQSIKERIDQVLLTGGFQVRKLTSNTTVMFKTREEIADVDRPIGDEVKTLGLYWSPMIDTFQYRFNTMDTISRITKRTVLALISQIYDPLGLVGPACIRAKIILQQLWRLKIGWDESLPNSLHTEWKRYYDQLIRINEISIHCLIVCELSVRVELHGFCDASESAYGACVYVRSITIDNCYAIKLLCAKSRVAPLKSGTLPRLELCGALLLSRLTQKVSSALTLRDDETYYWSDLKITLDWTAGEACNWKTFVANRVAEIQELTNKRQEENPADIISRGIGPEDLKDCHLRWNGPQWLSCPIDEYLNKNKYIPNTDSVDGTPESRTTTSIFVTTIDDFDILTRYSSLRTLTRVVPYCQRFTDNTQYPAARRLGSLSVHELNQATIAILKVSQAQTFSKELRKLRSKLPANTDSKGCSLLPFIDEIDLRFPIVLAPGNALTKLIIRDAHVKDLHADLQALLNILGERYWILSARSTVRKIIHDCKICFRMRSKNVQQLMGNLPSVRVTPSRAFENVGVDYGGPFNIKISRNKTAKAYLCLFICLATRAVHLEVVSELSTKAFLNTLKRFIDRRGKCTNIYSYNGTNFTGANNELKELRDFLKNETCQTEISNYSADHFIQWHFIPPYSPHMGGIWEAGIKSAKTHIKRVLCDALLTFEEFYTLITEIEACLNSRPISPMSSDPSDLSALKPGYFLIGAPLTAMPQANIQDIATNRLTRFQLLVNLQQHFWSRWSVEYLTQLQARTKWKEINVNEHLKPDTLVLLKDDKLSPLQWRLGRITALHSGKDGHVRVVNVRTSTGIVQRSLPKISIVPIAD